jgi:hypothetical protein
MNPIRIVSFRNNLRQVMFMKRSASRLLCITFLFFVSLNAIQAQIGNYVSNGSFEFIYNCPPPYTINKALYWSNIGSDTTSPGGALYSTGCFGNAPYTDVGFQMPRTGYNFARTTFFCLTPCSYLYSRGYPKNRLKANLVANKIYCVKMYAVLQNDSPHATSNLSCYFGDNSSDTIKYAHAPITYLNPQVKNPVNNIITDTMNWIPITGTFVATGNEKYLVVGNFESNAATTFSLVNTSWGNAAFAEYFIDDVSCIELDLPAYAGPDKAVLLGDSVYIGRESDFAIDSGCTWYKLPNLSTPITISSGLWVKPTTTSTYVVKQVLDCSAEKWDTVVVYMNLVGLDHHSKLEDALNLFPNPADDIIELQINTLALTGEISTIRVFNNLNQLVYDELFQISQHPSEVINIKTTDLTEGVYFLQISTENHSNIFKRFVIKR